MSELTSSQARALAALVAELRPGWDTAGILSALHEARTRASAYDVSIAAIRCASIATNRTPAVIPLDGAHWGAATVTPTARQPRCPIPGHEHELAAPHCRTCRSDELAAQAEAERAAGITPGPLVTTAQAARNLRGARAVLDAAPALDPARLAAGERDEIDE